MSGVFNIIGKGVNAALGAIGIAVDAIKVAIEIIDDWDSTDDVAAPLDGVSVNLTAKSAQKTEVDDGDAVKGVANLNGEQVLAGYTWATQSNRSEIINADRFSAQSDDLIDIANLAAGTHYYPSENGFELYGHKNFAIQGEWNDPDGDFDLYVEKWIGDDIAKIDFHDITKAGYDPVNNQTNQASISASNGSVDIDLDFDVANYTRIRVKVVNTGATNDFYLESRLD